MTPTSSIAHAPSCGLSGALPVRLIARLDIKGANVIKGVHLEGLRVVGQPAEMAHRYYADGVDEIVYMDVVASLYGRNSILDVITAAARDIFVPLTVGGGIRSVTDIIAALRAGADKVAINTAALARPDFLREAARAFGSQCIVLSIEAKRRGPAAWEALTDNGRERTGRDVLNWAEEAESLGIGEILLTSVDMEGTRKGFDIDLISAVRARVRVPVIASGGAGFPDDVADVARATSCDAVAIAGMLHHGLETLPSLKTALAKRGMTVRL